jgi:NADH-quinone oxidoreductase subunit H
MRLGWKVLIPTSLAWTLIIATLRVWRRQGGSTPVYIVAALIVAALLALWLGWEASAQRSARAVEAEEESAAEREREHGPAFPIPPMDLPHYHGVGPGVSGLSVGAPAAGPDDSSTTKEVTGA